MDFLSYPFIIAYPFREVRVSKSEPTTYVNRVLGKFSFVPVLGCKTIKGADANTVCILPFRYKGQTYDTCTLKDADKTNNEAWCSTKVDTSGKHVTGKGKWGNCGQGCPFTNVEGKYIRMSE